MEIPLSFKNSRIFCIIMLESLADKYTDFPSVNIT